MIQAAPRRAGALLAVVAIVLMLATGWAMPAGEDAVVRVGSNVQVSARRGTDVHYEVLGGSDPTNAKRMLSCVILSDQKAGKDTTVVYASSDGGATWNQTLDTRAFNMTGDPVCVYGNDGTAFYSALSIGSGTAVPSKTLLYRSNDGGQTWSSPLKLPIIDRQYIVTDRTGGKFKGRLYLHGTGSTRPIDSGERKNGIHLFTSTDNGLTWSGPLVAASMGNTWVLGTSPGVVLSDGTLVLLTGEVQNYLKPDGTTRDVGWGDERPNSKLKILLSEDGGDSFKPAVTIGDWYFAWPPTSICCVPWLAVDATSGPFKDRLYAVWTDLRSGRSEILISFSADKGKTWSKPATVNDDRPASTRRDHFKPVVEVNRAGVVGVMWHDRRDAADNLGWSIRFAASTDGGETFAPSVQVSSTANTFRANELWPLRGSATGGGSTTGGGSATPGQAITLSLTVNGMMFSGGHTAAMPVDASGVFHPMWVDNRTGYPQVWTAPVNVTGEVIRYGDRTLADLDDVTSRVSLEMSDLGYDRESNIAKFSVRVKNTSKEPLRGPLKVRIRSLSSTLGHAEILDGTQTVRGPGLVWDFSSLLSNGVLAPDALSGSRTVTVRFRNLRPFREDERRFRFVLLQADAIVLGRAEKKATSNE